MTQSSSRAGLVFLLSISLGLGACASHREWSATGGSRSEGVVRLTHEYGRSETADVSADQADMLALNRCQTWGYRDAEAFGGQTRSCTAKDGASCELWKVTREYQCTGQPATAAR